MSLITSLPKEKPMSDKKSYNYLALRGAPVDDMEYVEPLGYPQSLHTQIRLTKTCYSITMTKQLKVVWNQTQLHRSRKNAERDIRELLAKNGMLK